MILYCRLLVRTMRKPEVHLITGGGGYPGYMLGKNLIEHGHKVVLFDVRLPVWPLLDGMTFFQVISSYYT